MCRTQSRRRAACTALNVSRRCTADKPWGHAVWMSDFLLHNKWRYIQSISTWIISGDIISKQTLFNCVYMFVSFSWVWCECVQQCACCVCSSLADSRMFSCSCLKWFISDTFSVFVSYGEATAFSFSVISMCVISSIRRLSHVSKVSVLAK